ncbi:hypothetical protein BZM27_30485 [Paraburkholderia steynii]|uniref:Uncharacterized protein n=1 Tax=Paraburkholderia steynii TaxID=1245441 RepID=A0A4R0X6L3_9BURK|nr:hypothetical protein BZM27_30485 [Paraburkholderia steynii]
MTFLGGALLSLAFSGECLRGFSTAARPATPIVGRKRPISGSSRTIAVKIKPEQPCTVLRELRMYVNVGSVTQYLGKQDAGDAPAPARRRHIHGMNDLGALGGEAVSNAKDFMGNLQLHHAQDC